MNILPCIVIPVYNHGSTMVETLKRLVEFNFACIVVDDGSDEQTKSILQSLNDQYEFVTLLTYEKNRGKGAAFISGIKEAAKSGYTHAIQVDADGQHNLDDIPLLVEASMRQPEALVSGWPVYDESIPRSRLYGRYITHFWVWVETLSFSIKDSMCGFRVYPVAAVVDLLSTHSIGERMDFDTDIMVKMYWAGTPAVFIKSRIIYPESGISHFSVVNDNLRISWMHTRLVAGMLVRLPRLLIAKWKRAGVNP